MPEYCRLEDASLHLFQERLLSAILKQYECVRFYSEIEDRYSRATKNMKPVGKFRILP